MLSESEYVRIVDSLISSHLENKFAKKVRGDTELFGQLLEAVMSADWKWDGRGNKFGLRKQYFLWKVSAITKFLRREKRYYRCADFEHLGDSKYEANDTDLFYEEFKSRVKESGILTKAEKLALSKVVVELKPPNPSDYRTIKKGLSKLKNEYEIFNITGIRRHSKKNSEQLLSKSSSPDN